MAYFYASAAAPSTAQTYIGRGNSFNVIDICDKIGIEYKDLTANDFVIQPVNTNASGYNTGDVPTGGSDSIAIAVDGSDSFTISKSYDKNTGRFTCSCTSSSYRYTHNPSKSGGVGSGANANCLCDVYIFKEIK